MEVFFDYSRKTFSYYLAEGTKGKTCTEKYTVLDWVMKTKYYKKPKEFSGRLYDIYYKMVGEKIFLMHDKDGSCGWHTSVLSQERLESVVSQGWVKPATEEEIFLLGL